MILDLCKERANTIVELKESVEAILNVPTEYETAGVNKFIKDNTIGMLKKYCELLIVNEKIYTLHQILKL